MAAATVAKQAKILRICLRTRFRTFATVASQKTVQRCLGQPTSFSHPFLMKEDEVTPGLTKENYRQRRHDLVELISNEKTNPNGQISESHLIILLSSPVSYMTQDIPYPFHQNTNFSYLTGFQEPDSCLVMQTDTNSEVANHKSTLFVQKRDLLGELWNGARAGTDGALEHTGMDNTEEINKLGEFLKSLLSIGTTVWYDYNRMTNLQLHLSQVRDFLQETRNQGMKVRAVEGPLHEQRHIKTPEECELMSKACDIISKAFIDTMAFCRRGMNEAELNARMEYTAKLNGAQMLAFPPVVAAADRANTLHYVLNNQNIKDGSLVLVDAGALHHGYVSDVTRTWPINGKFSESQKILYEAVLRIQLLCISLCRPGHSLDEIYQTMTMALGKELYDIGVLKEKMKIVELTEFVRELCPHHVGHWLGMDVHDTSGIRRSIKLLPGMVVTIEPGLYIREDNFKVERRFRGIGIRIEDDILITAGDPVVLSGKCPKTVEEIETIMAK